MSPWIISPERRHETETRLSRQASHELGEAGLNLIRYAPAWFRAVHNGWPVIFAHTNADLIELFAMLLARDSRAAANWRAFLALCQHSHYQPEFLSAVGEWVKRAIDGLRFVRQTSHQELHETARQAFLCGFWDDPEYHGFGRFNPRVADEITTIALACSGHIGRIRRGILPLVRNFYSWELSAVIDTDGALKKLIAKVLSGQRTIEWCVRHPFTASFSGIKLPRVTCEAEQERMYLRLPQPPPRLISGLRGARFPTI